MNDAQLDRLTNSQLQLSSKFADEVLSKIDLDSAAEPLRKEPAKMEMLAFPSYAFAQESESAADTGRQLEQSLEHFRPY